MSWLIVAAECVTALAASVAAFQAYRARKKVEVIHIQINGRMDEMIAAAEKVAHATGVLEGREER